MNRPTLITAVSSVLTFFISVLILLSINRGESQVEVKCDYQADTEIYYPSGPSLFQPLSGDNFTIIEIFGGHIAIPTRFRETTSGGPHYQTLHSGSAFFGEPEPICEHIGVISYGTWEKWGMTPNAFLSESPTPKHIEQKIESHGLNVIFYYHNSSGEQVEFNPVNNSRNVLIHDKNEFIIVNDENINLWRMMLESYEYFKNTGRVK